MKPDVSITDWLAIGDNYLEYQKWLDNPITKRAIESIQWEQPVGQHGIRGLSDGDANRILGFNMGVDHVIRRLLTQHEEPEAPTVDDDTEMLTQSLRLMGVPEERIPIAIEQYRYSQENNDAG